MQRSFDDLYGGEPPHQRHSDTSTASADELPEERRRTLRAQVLAYIVRMRGATDEEMQTALGMEGNTERPRRRELQLGGLIVDSGQRRLTTSRRRAVVWIPRPAEEEHRG